jgi:hypothetical protein
MKSIITLLISSICIVTANRRITINQVTSESSLFEDLQHAVVTGPKSEEGSERDISLPFRFVRPLYIQPKENSFLDYGQEIDV